MPSTPRSPIVLRHRVTTRILLAASTRSLLLISFATAAAISGVRPRLRRGQLVTAGLASSRIHSRNSPTVEAAQRFEGLPVEPLENQPAHLIGVGIDQGMIDDLLQGQLGQHELGGDALALRRRGQARKLIARLLLVGHGEDLAKIGKRESLVADDGRQVHTWFLERQVAGWIDKHAENTHQIRRSDRRQELRPLD